ncbi:MAG: hypothetical protein LC641_09880 [Spirochaeta sp.]|nr:hypothetical protein [Spirochaeta sp.]
MKPSLESNLRRIAELLVAHVGSARADKIIVLMNPVAGGLAQAVRRRAHIAALEAAATRGPAASLPFEIYITKKAGDTEIIAAELMAQDHGRDRVLVLLCGGDGTYSQFLDVCLRAGPEVLKQFSFIRLPLGSGNDGADARDLVHATEIISKTGLVVPSRGVRVSAHGLPQRYAFNITSIGIDAYVTYLTNKLRKRLPGDTYKVVADLSTLFYDHIYGVGDMNVRVERVGKNPNEQLSGKFMLLAVGVSGYRCYGDHKWVLPDEHNVCAIRLDNMTLSRRLDVKKRLYVGTHVHDKNTEMLGVRKVTIEYERRIPLQLDGEGIWLGPENFPLSFELTEPIVSVLVDPADSGRYLQRYSYLS